MNYLRPRFIPNELPATPFHSPKFLLKDRFPKMYSQDLNSEGFKESIVFLTSNYGTHNPALVILRKQGFDVRVECYRRRDNSVSCTFCARKGDLSLSADSGAELLGLATILNTFGEEWNNQTDIMDEVIHEQPDPDEDQNT